MHYDNRVFPAIHKDTVVKKAYLDTYTRVHTMAKYRQLVVLIIHGLFFATIMKGHSWDKTDETCWNIKIPNGHHRETYLKKYEQW